MAVFQSQKSVQLVKRGWSASRAIRLFPTPAAPQITIPDAIASESAASMSPISAERPVQGHINRIYTA
jgi:hypothetical protein